MAASLDREGTIQMNSDSPCLLWFLLLLLLLFCEGRDMRERFCHHRPVCEPFFKTFNVRLCREARWMDVVSILRVERADLRRPISNDHGDGHSVCLVYRLNLYLRVTLYSRRVPY